MGAEEDAVGLASGFLALVLLNGLTGSLQVGHLLLQLGNQVGGVGLENLGSLEDELLVVVHCLQGQLAHGGLNAAHAAGHGALGLDAEGAHLGGVVQVGAAAELHGEVAHLHHAHHIAVLLAEHGHSALLLGLLNGEHLGDDGVAVENSVVDQLVHLGQLLGGDALEVGEVEADAVGLHQRACLVHVVAQHLFQSGVQQVGGGVGTADGLAALHVNGGGDGVAHFQHATGELAVVHILAALVLLHVVDGEHGLAQGDGAVVTHLAAHLSIEGGAVQHHDALHAAHHLLGLDVLHHHGQHLGVVDGVVVVAHELGLGQLLAELDTSPAQVAQGLTGLTGADLLLLHEGAEAGLIHGQALVLSHLAGQVDGESIGVVELEGVLAGEHGLALGLVLGQHVGENLQAAVDGLGEVLLLHPDDLGDIALLLHQVGVGGGVDLDDGVTHPVQEGVVDAQQLAVAGSPAEQTAQHVAAALVGGEHAVADHHGGGADVVGDDTQGHVTALALAIVGPGDLGDLVGDVHHSVGVKQRVDVLAHAGQTLQAHAGVDVLLDELGVVALAVVVELGEDVVPHLHIAVAVTAHGAPGLAAAVLLATVVVHLGAGAAGAGAVLPEVVGLAEAEDALGGDADLLVPDLEGLVVILVDGGVQAVGVQAHPLGAGQKLPAPGNGLPLEVVAEGEVAQHLKVGAVAGGLADVLNVTGADALLAGGDTAAGGLLLAGEPGLHGRHAAVDQQQRGVVLRNQGKAGQTQVSFTLKEGQEHLTQLVDPEGLGVAHGSIPPF